MPLWKNWESLLENEIMKPIKKTRQIPYWSCGMDVKGHYHASQKQAAICIAKPGKTDYIDVCREKHKRNKLMVSGFAHGQSITNISKSLDIPRHTVNRVCFKALDICNSRPGASYKPTRRIDGDRYVSNARELGYTTIYITLQEMRALVRIAEAEFPEWWGSTVSLSDRIESRDGPPLYKLSDEDINQIVK